MRGVLQHFKLTLGLNFRNRQALVYGYLVPFFFLIAFGSIFRSSSPPLLRQLGQLLTISVLGGACFGMPTALVAERERGIWRRYRLLPVSTGSLVLSTMAARFLIILSAAMMQVVLARLMYGMPFPEHGLALAVAFGVVTLAFLGMGLVIAMLADGVPAVQALGQAIFLPMIMIGGVGVPLWTLPDWAQHVAGFLPGKYAVVALQSCVTGAGLGAVRFELLALLLMGAAAGFGGAKMFRWDAQEKIEPRRRAWAVLALVGWLGVGLTAELMGRAAPAHQEPLTNLAHFSDDAFEAITAAQIGAVKYDDLPEDASPATPIARNLEGLDAEGRARMAEFRRQLAGWPPGSVPGVVRRVRNLLDAAAVADLMIDRYEGPIAYVILEKIRAEVPAEQLPKILTWIILHPGDETPVVEIKSLGVESQVSVQDVNERAMMYAAKLLGRITGKRP